MYLRVRQFRTKEQLRMWKSGIFPWKGREKGNIHTVSHKLSRVFLPLCNKEQDVMDVAGRTSRATNAKL